MGDRVYVASLPLLVGRKAMLKVLRELAHRRVGAWEPIQGGIANEQGVHIYVNGIVIHVPWRPTAEPMATEELT